MGKQARQLQLLQLPENPVKWRPNGSGHTAFYDGWLGWLQRKSDRWGVYITPPGQEMIYMGDVGQLRTGKKFFSEVVIEGRMELIAQHF